MLSFPGCAVRKGNAPGIQSGSPHPLRERIKTSDARGDRTRTSAWIPAMTARRTGGGVRLPAARLRAFGSESIPGAPTSSPRHPGYLRSPGKRLRMHRRSPKPNGIVGSPVRSTGGSLFLAVAVASVGSRICDLDLSGSLPFSIPLDSLPPPRSVRPANAVTGRVVPVPESRNCSAVASTNTFRYEIATANAGCRMDRTEVQSARTRSGAKVKKRSNVFTIGPERIKKPLNPTR